MDRRSFIQAVLAATASLSLADRIDIHGNIIERVERLPIWIDTLIDIRSCGACIGAVRDINVSENFLSKKTKDVLSVSGECDRVRFDKIRLPGVFINKEIISSAQYGPLEIIVTDIFEDGTKIQTNIENVWIKQSGVTYHADIFVIAQDVKWEGNAIHSEFV